MRSKFLSVTGSEKMIYFPEFCDVGSKSAFSSARDAQVLWFKSRNKRKKTII